MVNIMNPNDFSASTGMSRKWDAHEAGREVARNVIENLKSPPNFFLLFSSIHYQKNGGFDELLKGVLSVIPEGTPLIGGSVAGFINNYGCFSRGVSALSVSYPNMDVSIGYGENTKRNPKKATLNCISKISNELKNSSFKNPFLLDVISSGIVPQLPGMERKKVIKSKMTSFIASRGLGFSLKFLQKGAGRDEEILDYLINKNKTDGEEYNILSGSATDDVNQLSNFQFYNDKIFTNSIVAIGLKSDLQNEVYSTHGLKETGIKFKITETDSSKRLVNKINNNEAVPELLKILNWSETFLDEDIYKRIFYYPIYTISPDGKKYPLVIPYFLSNSLLFAFKLRSNDAELLTLSGKDLINAVKENINYFQTRLQGNKPFFGLISSCGMRIITLGKNVNLVRDELLKFYGKTPFLLYYVAGEGSYSPINGLTQGNYTFNMGNFWGSSI